MGDYPRSEVDRAMKVQEVIMRAMSGSLQWFEAAEIIGVSCRTMRRWKGRYEEMGTTDCLTGDASVRARNGCRWRR